MTKRRASKAPSQSFLRTNTPRSRIRNEIRRVQFSNSNNITFKPYQVATFGLDYNWLGLEVSEFQHSKHSKPSSILILTEQPLGYYWVYHNLMDGPVVFDYQKGTLLQ